MNWTDERIEKLKKLWSEGLSASQVAAQLGGVSRNAVIGKVHRLSLPARAKAADAAPSTAARTPKRTTSAPRAPNYTVLELVQLTDRTCKWPVGDPLKEDFHFCGNDSPGSLPYCGYHQKLAYVKPAHYHHEKACPTASRFRSNRYEAKAR